MGVTRFIQYTDGLASQLKFVVSRNEPDLSVKVLCPICLGDTRWTNLGIGKSGWCWRCGKFDAAVPDRSPLFVPLEAGT